MRSAQNPSQGTPGATSQYSSWRFGLSVLTPRLHPLGNPVMTDGLARIKLRNPHFDLPGLRLFRNAKGRDRLRRQKRLRSLEALGKRVQALLRFGIDTNGERGDLTQPFKFSSFGS